MAISRESYRKVKKMNREEMDAYLNQMYAEAYNAGISAVSHKMAEHVVNGLQKTPGIGEKRMKEAIENINKEINGQATQD